MRVKNNWKRPIRVGRQIIPHGVDIEIADHLLVQPRVQKLKKSGKLVFPYKKEQAAPMAVVVEEPVVPKDAAPQPMPADDLTQLIHIGTGRAKNLRAFGIVTFRGILDHADKLHEVLEITEDMAEEVVADAESKVG